MFDAEAAIGYVGGSLDGRAGARDEAASRKSADMSTSSDLSVNIGSFAGACTQDGKVISVTLSGEADGAGAGPLDVLLQRVHAHATATHASEVVLDVRQLGFMSAGCFTKVVGWVNRVREMESARRYVIRLKGTQANVWQRRSLDTLKSVAADVVTVEVSGAAGPNSRA